MMMLYNAIRSERTYLVQKTYKFTDAFPYLLNRAGVKMGECFSSELATYGITLPMYRVLAVVNQYQQLCLKELVEFIPGEMSTMSRLIANMHKMDLVLRERIETNNRTVKITLTEKGLALFKELMPKAQAWERKAISGFSLEEIEDLKQKLTRIYSNLV